VLALGGCYFVLNCHKPTQKNKPTKLINRFFNSDSIHYYGACSSLLNFVKNFVQTSLALAETQGLITIKQAFWGGLAATFLLINTKFLTKFSSDEQAP